MTFIGRCGWLISHGSAARYLHRLYSEECQVDSFTLVLHLVFLPLELIRDPALVPPWVQLLLECLYIAGTHTDIPGVLSERSSRADSHKPSCLVLDPLRDDR